MIITWFKNIFKCKHEKKKLLSSTPVYVDPHCRIAAFKNELKCAKCGEYITEYTRFKNEN